MSEKINFSSDAERDSSEAQMYPDRVENSGKAFEMAEAADLSYTKAAILGKLALQGENTGVLPDKIYQKGGGIVSTERPYGDRIYDRVKTLKIYSTDQLREYQDKSKIRGDKAAEAAGDRYEAREKDVSWKNYSEEQLADREAWVRTQVENKSYTAEQSWDPKAGEQGTYLEGATSATLKGKSSVKADRDNLDYVPTGSAAQARVEAYHYYDSVLNKAYPDEKWSKRQIHKKSGKVNRYGSQE